MIGANRNVRGPATRDVIRPKGHKPRLAIGAAYYFGAPSMGALLRVQVPSQAGHGE